MRQAFVRDGERWEAGSLTLTDFAARHPGTDVGALVGLRERLASAGSTVEPDAEQGWLALRDQLPERAPARTRTAWRFRRSLVGAFAILLVGSSIAYAAVEPVRHGVNHFVQTVTDVFTGVDEQGPTGDQGNVEKSDESGDTGSTERGDTGEQGNTGTDGGSGANQGPDSHDSGPSGDVGTDEGSGSSGSSSGPQGSGDSLDQPGLGAQN